MSDWKKVADKLLVENERLEAKVDRLKSENVDMWIEFMTRENILLDEIDRLKALLQDERKLSEERRVALEKCSPFYYTCSYEDHVCNTECQFCGSTSTIDEHEPICDYVRLIKQD